MLAAYDSKRGKLTEVARMFGVTRQCMWLLLRQREATGSIAPRHGGGRTAAYTGAALEQLGLEVIYPQGSYYVVADFSERFPGLSAKQFVDRMIDQTRVGAVPADDFVLDPENHRWVRVCFALPDEELERAAGMLQGLL